MSHRYGKLLTLNLECGCEFGVWASGEKPIYSPDSDGEKWYSLNSGTRYCAFHEMERPRLDAIGKTVKGISYHSIDLRPDTRKDPAENER